MNLSKIKEIEWRKVSEVHWQVILNRAEKYNAFTLPMYEQLTAILEEGARDEQLLLLSLTGKGRFFSSGADLTAPLHILVSLSPTSKCSVSGDSTQDWLEGTILGESLRAPSPSEKTFHTSGSFGLKFSGMSDPGEKRFWERFPLYRSY